MKKIKISELPLYSSLKGLFTIGTDANNRSVKVSLEFVEQQTTQAVTNAKEATDAANTAAAAANTAKKNADTATAAAKTATTNAIKAKEDADEATKKANAATDAANKAKEDCDTATEDAQEATTAANEATAAAQEATEEAVNATDNVLLTLGRLVPTGMTVESVTRLTVGNVKPNYIKAALSPASAMQNVIFISDNKAITVGTDGRITVVGRGKSTVYVIPTCNTALAKTLLIEVVAPALRKATNSSLRLTQSGALRFG